MQRKPETSMASEGYVVGKGGRTWYRILGSGSQVLVLLHGGPGAGSGYLASLNALARGRRLVNYDQLGCGKSDQPNDDGLWTIERFVAELELIRCAVGGERIHLFGHSWGGMLGLEYTLAHPEHIASLTLASTTASI